MRRRDVRWSTLFGILGALVYGGAQVACSSSDDSGGGGAPDAAVGDATGGGVDAASDAGHDAEPDAAGSDADRCFPSGAMPRSGGYLFPTPGSGACSDAQLDAVYTRCFTAGSSRTSCDYLKSTVGYETCFACLIGSSTVSPQPPLVYTTLSDDSTLSLVNTAGCIAAFDPAQQACAEANAVADNCENDQCTGCRVADFAPVPADPYGNVDLCTLEAAADGGRCATFQSAETECDEAIVAADGGAARCFSLFDDGGAATPSYLAYMTLVCGSASAAADAGDGGD